MPVEDESGAPDPENDSEESGAETQEPGASTGDGADDLDVWKGHARRHEREAKKVRAELERLRRESMTEQERAIETARAEARAAALGESAKKVAVASFRAAAADAGVKLGGAADLIDTSRFVRDDGEVDDDAIAQAVKQLADMAKPSPSSPTAGPQGGSPTPKKSFLLNAIDAATV